MADKSIYESGHPARRANSFAICFGRVTAVYPDTRFCQIKTFFATDNSVNDKTIDNCQWLYMDANPAGDECTSVPREGAMGIVIIVHGEAFIIGFFKALNSDGAALTGNEVVQLTAGDKVFSTVAGNYITIKANGSIEIKSKETLSTLYFPTKSLLRDLCRNYEFTGDGGFLSWKSDDKLNTLFNGVYRNNLAPIAVVVEQNGAVDGGLTTIRRIAVAPGNADNGIYVYEQTIDVDGTVTTTVGPPGVAAYVSTINPDGSFSIDNGPEGSGAYSAAVDAAGNMDLAFGPLVTLSVKIDGSIDVTTPGLQFSADATGNISVDSTGSGSFTFAQDVDIVATGDVSLTALGSVTLSGLGLALDGMATDGAAAMFGVLTFPNVIDPLTGTPLGPGSTSVLASI